MIIPRGGKNLIQVIAKDSSVPVLKHYDGLCHVYIDEKADFNKAKEIALNAKTYRYGICGAMETLLISEKISSSLVSEIIKSFEAKSVEIRGCEQTCKNFDVSQASEEDWTSEYLAPILSIKTVKNVDEVLKIALTKPLLPIEWDEEDSPKSSNDISEDDAEQDVDNPITH